MKLNIRNKLIIFAVMAIIIPLGVSALIILYQLSKDADLRSTERIKSDARVAKSFFDKRQENLRSASQSIAQAVASGRVAARPAAPPTGPAAAGAPAPAPAPATSASSEALKRQLEANRLSFVVLLDPKGKVLAQHNSGPVGDGNQFSDNALFKGVSNRAQSGNPEAQSGVVAEKAPVLAATGLKDLAAVAGVEDGLFVEAASPVLSGESLQGIVLVGQLVNNDNAVTDKDKQQSIVNEIKETIYRDLRDQAGVVIADSNGKILTTNLTAGASGGSATGQTVTVGAGTIETPSFNEATFGGGTPYYTSFVPIQSSDQQQGAKTVGHIGVAIKQSWFTEIVRRVQFTILVVTILALALAVAGAVFGAQKLTRPIVELTDAANRISLGELDVPIAVQSDDEIGTLGESLDRMRISLKQAIERLRKR